MDQLKYHVGFNLSTIDFSKITQSTFTFSTKNPDQPKIQLDRVKYMTLDTRRPSIPGDLTVKFVNKTNGEPFDLSSNDFSVSKIHKETDNKIDNG